MAQSEQHHAGVAFNDRRSAAIAKLMRQAHISEEDARMSVDIAYEEAVRHESLAARRKREAEEQKPLKED
jgi:hypothetical protein